MKTFTRDDLQTLLALHEGPCVSLYIPTERGLAAGPANHLAFKNGVKTAERHLNGSPNAAKVLARLNEFDAATNWGELRGTLCVFAAHDFFESYAVAESLALQTEVASTFLTRPLVKHLQDQVRYYVLSLSKENITLLEGTNGSLDPVRVPGMPRGMREFQTHHINHGTSHRFSSGSGMGAGHGGSEFDHEKEDMKALFKAVDRALIPITHGHRNPLILATFHHYSGTFHDVSKNPSLMEESIDGDPTKMTRDVLRERALAILSPHRQAALSHLAEQYKVAVERRRGTNYIPSIAKSALSGRVATLLVEDGRRIVGQIDRTTGEVPVMSGRPQAEGQDLIDEVAELVLGTSGSVYVLPKELMPTDSGVAAILRY